MDRRHFLLTTALASITPPSVRAGAPSKTGPASGSVGLHLYPDLRLDLLTFSKSGSWMTISFRDRERKRSGA